MCKINLQTRAPEAPLVTVHTAVTAELWELMRPLPTGSILLSHADQDTKLTFCVSSMMTTSAAEKSR